MAWHLSFIQNEHVAKCCKISIFFDNFLEFICKLFTYMGRNVIYVHSYTSQLYQALKFFDWDLEVNKWLIRWVKRAILKLLKCIMLRLIVLYFHLLFDKYMRFRIIAIVQAKDQMHWHICFWILSLDISISVNLRITNKPSMGI